MPGSGQNFPRRSFLRSLSMAVSVSAMAASLSTARGFAEVSVASAVSSSDAERMRVLAAWTMDRMTSPNPVPYAAEIFDTTSGISLMRASNAVFTEHDPSAHGEIATIRLACKKLHKASLRGYTLYTTCEPCPMCMACCLWAGLDRVVYGATIEDAARFGHQIMIPAAEVAKRTDMRCVVDGPVERERCLELFTNPRMQEAFRRWKAEG